MRFFMYKAGSEDRKLSACQHVSRLLGKDKANSRSHLAAFAKCLSAHCFFAPCGGADPALRNVSLVPLSSDSSFFSREREMAATRCMFARFRRMHATASIFALRNYDPSMPLAAGELLGRWQAMTKKISAFAPGAHAAGKRTPMRARSRS